MKKLCSLFLAVSMLLTVFIPAVHAEDAYKQIVVDNNRTRIEFTSAVSIAAGTSISVNFIVPVDGNYAFMAHKNANYYGKITAAVTSGKPPYGL